MDSKETLERTEVALQRPGNRGGYNPEAETSSIFRGGGAADGEDGQGICSTPKEKWMVEVIHLKRIKLSYIEYVTTEGLLEWDSYSR